MDIQSFYTNLLQPSETLIREIAKIDGDIIILGAGGKMGPSIARLARQAIDLAGVSKKIIAISRYSEIGLQKELEDAGVRTVAADLLNEDDLQSLPTAPNVLYLAGMKFGTTGKESLTWAMNSYLPGRIAEKYKRSRIVVFSTGNVYPLTTVLSGGATEDQLPEPIGEYAQSCLGRERIFQYFSAKNNTPILIYRLNYANDVTYGVLLEIARSVKEQRPVNLRMGHVNVIWQGNANEMALRSIQHCAVPSKILNIAGPETVSVRWLAREFGKIFNQEASFTGDEQSTALLSNGAESYRLFGYPSVPLKSMIHVIAEWINQGGRTLNKPTHFQERDGKF